jgi:hypothetical protein
MDQSELRIGNLIASSGNPSNKETWIIGKVISISSLNTDFEQLEIETDEEFTWFFKDNYFGIPLSIDILKNMGFKELRDGIYQFWSKDVGIFQVIVCSDNNGFGIRIWVTGTFGRTIYYVHDFQNLFYSLTGVELDTSKLIN